MITRKAVIALLREAATDYEGLAEKFPDKAEQALAKAKRFRDAIAEVAAGSGQPKPAPVSASAASPQERPAARAPSGSWKPADCNGCGRPIGFAVTKKGKNMPVDAASLNDADRDALARREKIDYRHGQHKPHFLTCPKAKDFRKD